MDRPTAEEGTAVGPLASALVSELRAKPVLTDAERLARTYVTIGIVPWRVYRIGGYGLPANDNGEPDGV